MLIYRPTREREGPLLLSVKECLVGTKYLAEIWKRIVWVEGGRRGKRSEMDLIT
jgi:hypothetical protein